MAATFSSQENQVLYENRFCNQEHFDIIISGNHNYLDNMKYRSPSKISYPELEKLKRYTLQKIVLKQKKQFVKEVTSGLYVVK